MSTTTAAKKPQFAVSVTEVEAIELDAFAEANGMDRAKLIRAALQAYTGITLTARERSLARDFSANLDRFSPVQLRALQGIVKDLTPEAKAKYAREVGLKPRDLIAARRD
jgi:hypothetical protein